MSNANERVRGVASLVVELRDQHGVKANAESCGPLLFVGVAERLGVESFHPLVERCFGQAYKPAGTSAFFKNLSDPLVRQLGGIRKEQTLFALELGGEVTAYCMFWPWGSNPEKVSVRVGFVCESREAETDVKRDFQI